MSLNRFSRSFGNETIAPSIFENSKFKQKFVLFRKVDLVLDLKLIINDNNENSNNDDDHNNNHNVVGLLVHSLSFVPL